MDDFTPAGDSPAVVAYLLTRAILLDTITEDVASEAGILDLFAKCLASIGTTRTFNASRGNVPSTSTNGSAEIVAFALARLISKHATPADDGLAVFQRALVAALGRRVTQ